MVAAFVYVRVGVFLSAKGSINAGFDFLKDGLHVAAAFWRCDYGSMREWSVEDRRWSRVKSKQVLRLYKCTVARRVNYDLPAAFVRSLVCLVIVEGRQLWLWWG